MTLKVGGSDVAALYVGAALVDAAYLGSSLVSDGGGGGGDYVADAITISDHTRAARGADLTGVVDGPTGFVSMYVSPSLAANGIDFALGLGGNFEIRIEPPDPGNDGVTELQVNFYDTSGNHTSLVLGSALVVDWNEWNHILFAWDVGHAQGERRYALYHNDVLSAITVDYEDGDADFNIDYTAGDFYALSPGTGPGPLSFADYGVWFNSSIVEADNTITEVNRRKFISATGKPADPANWPAGAAIKFSGDASTFLTNQGSGGAFTLTMGSMTNATTSPSD